jgi:hypothetical protein
MHFMLLGTTIFKVFLFFQQFFMKFQGFQLQIFLFSQFFQVQRLFKLNFSVFNSFSKFQGFSLFIFKT